MNRVRPIPVCLITLLSPLFINLGSTQALAQFGRLTPMAQRPIGSKPFVGIQPMPPAVMQKPVNSSRAGQSIVAQTVDLTSNTPLVQDTNPSWPKSSNPQNELPIVFQSNRDNLDGSTVLTSGLFHIYRMDANGNGVAALTGPNAGTDATGATIGVSTSQSQPSFNETASKVLYVDTDTNGNVELMELDLNANTVKAKAQSNLGGWHFTAINLPEYGPSLLSGSAAGRVAIFAGTTTVDTHYHVYAIDLDSGNIAKLTGANGEICDDMNPVVSPDGNYLAFDSNRSNAGGLSVKTTRDIWVITTNPASPNPVQITNFGSGNASSNNIQPSWSTNKQDQPTGSQHIIRGQQLLAFASDRIDSTNNGLADGINPNGTHDIYWMTVIVNGVLAPETTTNVPRKLNTSDKSHVYDDLCPVWPQFITSYRVAYQTNRSSYDAGSGNSSAPGQPCDIFSSTVIDLNAPTLIRYDDVTGDICSVSPRISSPGTNVTIKVKVADLESGMPSGDPVFGDGVFVQVKNPNSKYQSNDNVEHKVYNIFTGFNPDNNHTIVNTPVEYESEPIYIGGDPGNAKYNTYPRPTNPNMAEPPIYLPGNADYYAFSGAAHAPDPQWLPLKLESFDSTTGIGTYSATWATPSGTANASDYVMDVIVYDNSLNPFSASPAYAGMNWKIYDNIYGFTTQFDWRPAHNILFVSDYSAGQKFFSSRYGVNTLVNVGFTFYGTESWLTDIDVNLLPTQYAGTTPGPVANMLNTLGVKSYSDGLTSDGSTKDGYQLPATQQYDMWRILCRGPLPDSILSQYLPHTETQPADTVNGETTPRKVVVAPRCVVWNAPYTGDVFTNAGTLSDLTVQSQLHNFLQSGGRMMVTGQDIAWALSLGGAASNSFLSNDLRATYVGDYLPDPVIGGWDQLVAAGATNPITWDPWVNALHSYPGPNTPWFPISAEAEFVTPGILNNTRSYACPGVQWCDRVTPLTGVTWDMKYHNDAAGNSACIHYADAASASKVVYVPMGLEGLNSDAYTDNTVLVMKNRRAELMHNAVCYFRTGTITGRVVDLEAGSPVVGALVRLKGPDGLVDYTGTTDSQGYYNINGVVPAAYDVSAVRPGFNLQKPSSALTHGGYRGSVSFRMTQAQPVTVTGTVTKTDGTTPVVGATVTAKEVTAGTLYTATTDTNGKYTIERLPASTKYTLTVTATGYGDSVPISYTLPDPTKDPGDTLVVPAKSYTGYDFQLKAEQGSATGYVYKKNTDGTKGDPISGSTVTATYGSTTTTVVAITDSTGKYTFDKANTTANGLDPGTWSLVATAPGYAPNTAITVTVTSATSVTAADILLSPVAPGSISGLVTRSSDSGVLSGVTITLTDTSGAVIATGTTTTATTTSTGYRYNYLISNVPAGVTYTVTASLSGFTPTVPSVSAAVASQVETKNINFSMDPLHTFGSSLALVSAPYDYSGTDVAQLLSISDVSSFTLASWDLAQYTFYPNSPANQMKLGRGYFMAYKNNIPLGTQGTPAVDGELFDIPLNTGWNLIGDPFLFGIDWTKVAVVYNGVTLTHDQAVAQGLIGTTLYSYAAGSYVINYQLSPWKGYFVRAYTAVTLRIDPVNDAIGKAATIPATGRAVLGGGSGWSVNLRAIVGSLHDDDNYIGVSSLASDGFDAFKAEKPPVFGSRYANLTIEETNWSSKSGSYGVDIWSASAGTKSWNLKVATSEANSMATLTWPNAATLNKNVVLTLTDKVTGATRNLRTTGSYSWQTGSTAETRSFTIVASPADRSALRISNVVARSAANRSAGVNISYNLSAAADVEVRILAQNGTVVRSLTGRVTRAAGIQQNTWDLKNDQAVAMPSGTYQIEIRAQSTDGNQTVRQTVPVLVIR